MQELDGHAEPEETPDGLSELWAGVSQTQTVITVEITQVGTRLISIYVPKGFSGGQKETDGYSDGASSHTEAQTQQH